MPEFKGLQLSESVASAVNELSPDKPLTSWEIVEGILELHPEYGGGRGKELLYAIKMEIRPPK
jgi:hypothetical protein